MLTASHSPAFSDRVFNVLFPTDGQRCFCCRSSVPKRRGCARSSCSMPLSAKYVVISVSFIIKQPANHLDLRAAPIVPIAFTLCLSPASASQGMVKVDDTLYLVKPVLCLRLFRVQQGLLCSKHFQIIGGRMTHQQFRLAYRLL